MEWNDKRVLVTGAGGFIASHLAERLAQCGARVRAFVHYNAMGRWGWIEDSPARAALDVRLGDITDRDSVRQAFEDVDYVFHLAALITIPYSYHAPSAYIHTNVMGALNVMQAAREVGVERVVHTSTSEVYGTALRVPIAEDHPLQAQSPYAASKIGADKIAEAFHLSFGVPVVTVRPFNTYGPRQSARSVIPAIITQCLTGDTVRLGHLTPTRDMNYVSDTVEGFLLAAAAPAAVGKTINVGSGREIAVGDLAHLIARLMGRTIRIESDFQRLRPESSEVERLVADNTLARRLLGWQPAVTLEDGLERTIAWIRDHFSDYRPDVYAE